MTRTPYRTATAGSLRAEHAGQSVTLSGWVARRRDHGGVTFVDLRDASGYVQIVLREADAHHLRAEYCVRVEGTVGRRPAGNENPELPTGEIEVTATALEVLSESAPLPFPIDGQAAGEVGEEARLKYRYLDLRRAVSGDALRLRSKVEPGGQERADRRGLRRGRDAHADPLHARGCPGLPGAGAAPAGQLVRAAAVAAAVQAAADGRRHGEVLPDRALLPGRGLPRRPAAGVHPARHRDELRPAGRRDRARRAGAGRGLARAGRRTRSRCRCPG